LAAAFEIWVFSRFAYRDKRVVGVFCTFSCAASAANVKAAHTGMNKRDCGHRGTATVIRT
jgi:hypothetical protein